MDRSTSLLIIGAGPFGLAMAAYARHWGLDHLVVGRAMEFWREHMPEGMFLRSGIDWHLDPLEEDTMERFLSARGLTAKDADPLPLDLYLDYAEWFRRRKRIDVLPDKVLRLRPGFVAEMGDGSRIRADHVLVALGFRSFPHIPFHWPRMRHTVNFVDLKGLARRRVLIVGGRQSAFEWAALLGENGAREVHVVHRHPTPAFRPSDWSWVTPLLEKTADEPGWFARLPEHERDGINQRFYREGRLKLEPWLEPRIGHARLWPNTTVEAVEEGDELCARLSNGETLAVDDILLATGYRVDLPRVALFAPLLDEIRLDDGYPALDRMLQTTVPGLFITSLAATRAFGLFFGFTAAVRASAKIVGRAVAR